MCRKPALLAVPDLCVWCAEWLSPFIILGCRRMSNTLESNNGSTRACFVIEEVLLAEMVEDWMLVVVREKWFGHLVMRLVITGLLWFVSVALRIRRPQRQVVAQQLHNEGWVFVRVFVQCVQLCYRIIKRLRYISVWNYKILLNIFLNQLNNVLFCLFQHNNAQHTLQTIGFGWVESHNNNKNNNYNLSTLPLGFLGRDILP